MKALKKLLVLLMLIIGITTVALWALAKTVNPETLKHYVSTQLTTLTHQQSRVDGKISWHLFPRPGVNITKVQVGEENDQAPYSVQLENLLFNLKITPLLRGKLVFNELNIDGFKIKINADQPVITRINNQTASKSELKTNLTGQFAIERLLLSRGQLIIVQNQKVSTFSGLQIGANQLNLQQDTFPLQLKANLGITSANKKILKTQLNFQGSTSLSLKFLTNPVIALQNMPIDGQLSMSNLRIHQVKISKINGHLKTRPGILLLNPLTLSLYKGESVGNLKYEFASKKLIISQTATNIDSSKLVYDLLGKYLFKGNLDFSIHAQANLQNSNWQDNIVGNGSLTIKDGIFEAINLDKVIEETSNKINQLNNNAKTENLLQLAQFDNPEFFKGNTSFKLFGFQYLLQNAKLESNSIVLQTDKLQLKGDGILNLKDTSLDSHLFARINLTDSNLANIQQLLGGNFPILVKGTLTEPQVLPDLQKINPILTSLWLKDTLTKPVKKIGQTLDVIFDQHKKL